MKTRFLQRFGLGLALSVLPFVAGCNQQPGAAPGNSTNAVVLEPAALSSTGTSLPLAMESTAVPAPPVVQTLPANIKPSAPLAEIVKLANAGVEENVLLAYVNSSQSAFNLGSDEIIYLNDLGVPDTVVTAMIERDQFLKQPWSPPAQTGTTEVATATEPEEQEEPVAAAPTYVNSPEPYPVEQPQQVVNYNYFYSNLSPYGSWTHLDGYGWCWQPTVVALNRNWQPYCDRGRWAYTDSGWYWHSDYSWGLTFHYGRWFNHPSRGWCWWPDRVWAPSWVTWRYNDNYCGWAPLPPRCHYRPGFGLAYHNGSVGVSFNFGLSANCYTFVSWGGFCDSRPSRHRLPHAQAATVINNTTIVNNIVSGNNNTVINQGLSPERVSQHAGRPVRRTTVREAQTQRGRDLLAERQNRDAETITAGRTRGPGSDSMLSSRMRNGRANSSSAGIETVASTATTPAQPSSPTQPAVTPPTPSPVRPDADLRNTRENGTPRRGPSEGRDRRPQSLIVRGSDFADQPAAQVSPPQSAPAGSLVVIGRRNDEQSRGRSRFTPPAGQNTPVHNQVQPSAPETGVQQPVVSAPQTPASTPNVTRNWSAPASERIQRQDDSRLNRQQSDFRNQRVESRFENRPSGPVVVNHPSAPAYQPPVSPQPAPRQFNPAPAPQPVPQRFNNPAPQPAPVNVAPRVERVQPQSAPDSGRRSEAPSRSSDSGGSDRGNSGRSDRQR